MGKEQRKNVTPAASNRALPGSRPESPAPILFGPDPERNTTANLDRWRAKEIVACDRVADAARALAAAGNRRAAVVLRRALILRARLLASQAGRGLIGRKTEGQNP